METSFFPIFIDVQEMHILVIGGGRIAARRIATLLKFSTQITVIAPDICDQIICLEKEGKVRCKQMLYKSEEIGNADMVLAVTDNRDLNKQIAQECKTVEQKQRRKIFLNVADDRTLCDFYFPSIIQKDGITIGINSGGENPGKVKAFRQKLERHMEL